MSDPVLTHYDPDLPLKLIVDASGTAVGAILAHVFPDGRERPIAYASRMLSEAQKRYPQIEREAWSIVFGVTRFKDYLFGRKFDLTTDHRPLLHIFGEKKGLPIFAANRLQRWAYLLSNFNYTLTCVKSEENRADYLSRIETSSAPSRDAESRVSYINFIHEQYPYRINWKEVRRLTRTDTILAKVVGKISKGEPLPKEDALFTPFVRRELELTVDHDCLMWGYRVVIPVKLRKAVLSQLHSNHLGITKMKSLARSYFWWPEMDQQIEEIASNCGTCNQFRNNPPKAALKPWTWPKMAWTRLHVDFLGPMRQNIYALVIQDATSKWIEAFLVQAPTAAVTMDKLTEIFARFGIPRSISTDGARCFTGTEFSSFLQHLGIHHLVGAPFHPQSNGAAESAVKIVKRCLQKALADKAPLNRALNQFLLLHRSSVHPATGDSPANLLLKRRLRTIFDQLAPSSEEEVEKYQDKMVHQGGTRFLRLPLHQPVWVQDYRQGTPKWCKGAISKILGDQTYEVTTLEGLTWRRHLDQLWRATTGEEEEGIMGLPDNPNKETQQQTPTTDSNKQYTPGSAALQSAGSSSQSISEGQNPSTPTLESTVSTQTPQRPKRNRKPIDRLNYN